MTDWTQTIPAACREFLDEALLKLDDERKNNPWLPRGQERFNLDFKYDAERNVITQGGMEIPDSGQLFATPTELTVLDEWKQHYPTLVLMVRQENNKVERMVNAFCPYISSYVILDTGSTDDTVLRIQHFLSPLPGTIYVKQKFTDFGTDRTLLQHLVHQHYHDRLRNPHSTFTFVSRFVILVDADYTFVVDLAMHPEPEKIWTNKLKDEWKEMHDIYLGTTGENLDYWRPHLYNVEKRKKRYMCRTHEYLEDDPKQEEKTHEKYPYHWMKVQKLQGVKIRHVGDGEFGQKSNKFRRDVIWLFMDLLDGLRPIRSFEYITRMGVILRNTPLVLWASKEFMKLSNSSDPGGPEIRYCNTQEYAKGVYLSIPLNKANFDQETIHKRISKALSPILYGIDVTKYTRLETMGELISQLNDAREFRFAVSLGSLFALNDRENRSNIMFWDSYAHKIGFPRDLAIAGYWCKPYHLMALYLYYVHLSAEPQWMFAGERRVNDSSFDELKEKWENHDGTMYRMTIGLLTRLSAMALSEYQEGEEMGRNLHHGKILDTTAQTRRYEQAYNLWELCLCPAVDESDLPATLQEWIHGTTPENCQVWDLFAINDTSIWRNIDFMKQHPLWGFKQALRIDHTNEISSIDSTRSEIAMRLYICSKQLHRSVWTQVAHLIDAWKFNPLKVQDPARELFNMSRNQTHSMCSSLLKICRLMHRSFDGEKSYAIQSTAVETLVQSEFKSSKLKQDMMFNTIRLTRHDTLNVMLINYEQFAVDMASSSAYVHSINWDPDVVEASRNWFEKHKTPINYVKLGHVPVHNYGDGHLTAYSLLFFIDPRFTNAKIFSRIPTLFQQKSSEKDKRNTLNNDVGGNTQAGFPTMGLWGSDVGSSHTIGDAHGCTENHSKSKERKASPFVLDVIRPICHVWKVLDTLPVGGAKSTITISDSQSVDQEKSNGAKAVTETSLVDRGSDHYSELAYVFAFALSPLWSLNTPYFDVLVFRRRQISEEIGAKIYTRKECAKDWNKDTQLSCWQALLFIAYASPLRPLIEYQQLLSFFLCLVGEYWPGLTDEERRLWKETCEELPLLGSRSSIIAMILSLKDSFALTLHNDGLKTIDDANRWFQSKMSMSVPKHYQALMSQEVVAKPSSPPTKAISPPISTKSVDSPLKTYQQLSEQRQSSTLSSLASAGPTHSTSYKKNKGEQRVHKRKRKHENGKPKQSFWQLFLMIYLIFVFLMVGFIVLLGWQAGVTLALLLLIALLLYLKLNRKFIWYD